MPPYQPLGDLWLDFPDHGPATIAGFRRELDLDAGVARLREGGEDAALLALYFQYGSRAVLSRILMARPSS